VDREGFAGAMSFDGRSGHFADMVKEPFESSDIVRSIASRVVVILTLAPLLPLSHRTNCGRTLGSQARDAYVSLVPSVLSGAVFSACGPPIHSAWLHATSSCAREYCRRHRGLLGRRSGRIAIVLYPSV
jgi:hypothetical protein